MPSRNTDLPIVEASGDVCVVEVLVELTRKRVLKKSFLNATVGRVGSQMMLWKGRVEIDWRVGIIEELMMFKASIELK